MTRGKISARRRMQREILRYTVMAFVFAMLAVIVACCQFFLWYFFQTPTWLMVLVEAFSFIGLINAGVIYEAVEQEKRKMHKIFD